MSRALSLLLPALMVLVCPASAATGDLACYAGDAGRERFYCVLELSDRTILVGGMSSSLDWLPAATPRVELSATAANGVAVPAFDSTDLTQNRYALILRVSADGRTILKAFHFPRGVGGCVQAIRSSAAPGQPGGDVYISGFWTKRADATPARYWIGRLDRNMVSADPARLAWIYTDCAAGGERFMQLWDVGGDGKVVFSWYKDPAAGAWHVIHRLKADGSGYDTVPDWWDHGEGFSACLSLKPGSGDMRSLTQADYDLVTPDGHGGSGKKKGRYPYDFYYKGPKGINDQEGGFTGYSSDGTAATSVAVCVDRRDNTMYIGFNNGNPQNTHDFEPMVAAFRPDGSQIWYSHLYTVWSDSNGNGVADAGETFQCPPDQYVDGIAVDYSRPVGSPEIVVLARSHGNAPANFWSGVNSFHNGFTGTNGNEHMCWLGRFRAGDGSFVNASWNAEYDPFKTGFGAAYADPNLDGWPDHNKGWPSLKTTKTRGLVLDNAGNAYVCATGRGPLTTANAFQKMTRPGGAAYGCWSDYARSFKSDFSTLLYSTALTDPWDSTTGSGGGAVSLSAVWPVAGGLVCVGYHAADSAGAPGGSGPMPTAGVPSWGSAAPSGESAVFARLTFSGGQGVTERGANAGGRPAAPTAFLRGERLVMTDNGEALHGVTALLLSASGKTVARLGETALRERQDSQVSWRCGPLPAGGYFLILRSPATTLTMPVALVNR